jgi:ethanolamine ammonia-lyase large subunit
LPPQRRRTHGGPAGAGRSALRHFLNEALVPYEDDEVTRLIIDSHDAAAFAPVAHLTVGGLRDWLLSATATPTTLAALAPGLMPEMAAAVSKLMRQPGLDAVARKCQVVTAFRNTIGLPGHLAVRLQPNHPTDDLRGVAASMLDGLMYGCGDAVIGINPASDSLLVMGDLLRLLDEVIQRHGIPTQGCVLTHVTNTLRLIEQGVPVDLVFQSVAGTQKANAGFGVTLALLREAQAAALSLQRGTVGRNVMYFETGQGSALSAERPPRRRSADAGARAYGVARAFSPLLTNTVVGFIGPEYLYDGKQIIRAGLEDHFCGKLLGVPLGCDICYTNHAEADSDDMDTLMTLAGRGRRQLHHGRARGRRHHAQLPEHLVPRRGCAAPVAGPAPRARVRSLARARGHCRCAGPPAGRTRWPGAAGRPVQPLSCDERPTARNAP